MKKCWLVLAVLLGGTVSAEELVIQSFDADGTISFNEIPYAVMYRVEWAPGPGGPWKLFTQNQIGQLNSIPATGTGVASAAVPMAYRVVASIREPADFSLIPAGTFMMGSPSGEPGRESIEVLHGVTLTRGFFIQKTEVTNREMADVMNWALAQGLVSATLSTVRNLEGDERELLNLDADMFSLGGTTYGDCQIYWDESKLEVDAGKDDFPCVWVTWYGAQAYCNYLSDIEGLDRAVNFPDWRWVLNASGYRLPTEAEWEYACRAGTTTAFYTGGITYTDCSVDPNLDTAGWYCGNSEGSSQPVRLKSANAWSLFDMHGNVWEWCADWYEDNYPGTVTDPRGPPSGTYRVCRGGGWNWEAWICRSALRGGSQPGSSYFREDDVGFRPVRTVVP